MDAAVVHECDEIVAVSKRPGETVVPAGGPLAEECLHRRMERALGARLWVVHRLDRDTSGVVVFARSADAHRALSLAFERRRVQKTYVAFTSAMPPSLAGRLETPLHGGRRGRMRPAREHEPGIREAVTAYKVLRSWHALRAGEAGDHVAQVELVPTTGRHHQLRVHLRAAGAPVLFDRIYGRGVAIPALANAPCGRLALHALRLALPSGAGLLTIEAPLAPDLVALRDWLDLGWIPGRTANA